MFENVKFYWNCWTVTDLRYFPKFCLLLKCKGRRSSGQSLMPWTLKMESSAKENSYWIIYILFWLTATYVCTYIRYIKNTREKKAKKIRSWPLFFEGFKQFGLREAAFVMLSSTQLHNGMKYERILQFIFMRILLVVLHYIIGNCLQLYCPSSFTICRNSLSLHFFRISITMCNSTAVLAKRGKFYSISAA